MLNRYDCKKYKSLKYEGFIYQKFLQIIGIFKTADFVSKIDALQQFKNVIRKMTFNIGSEAVGGLDHPSC